ncbi:AlbA family DNA-binding domain-containing protein [Solimonas sp. K1W22B-7]|uniref:AlbA family DNA-binding domain-containing protein n=1 Tax=Solimonas sp. K1W22B-7 TaxID=2303331 RepID=UPI0013C4D9D3|nr:ATP-binding protein [Solimonas sp. K1W22B-7]
MLEFKGSDALSLSDNKKKNEISKDVSAFANSAGGTLIYAVVENDAHMAAYVDSGIDPHEISKEWLEQQINSNIQRRIDGIRIHQVDLSGGHGRVAYVVEIPQSDRAPHQASDTKFYKRFNFQSIPMEEYEIRDVSRRSEAPDLFMDIGVIPTLSVDQEQVTEFRLSATVGNKAVVVANHAIIALFVDDELKLREAPGYLSVGMSEYITFGDTKRAARRYSYNHMPNTHMPLFEGVEFSLWDYPGFVFDMPSNGSYLLGWRILAPGMPMKEGVVLIKWNGARLLAEKKAENYPSEGLGSGLQKI